MSELDSAPDGTGDTGSLSVAAVHCTACDMTRYPAQTYGCEQCGAHGEALRQVDLAARGVISSWATVHAHRTIPAPYTVVEVTLDDGPLVRGLLDPATRATAGTRVEATAHGPGDLLVYAAEGADQ